MQSTCGTAVPGCAAGTAISRYTYGLGPAGNRTSVAELSGRSLTYVYDDLYRLTSETISGAVSQSGTIGYAYDAVGNRLSMTSTIPAIPAGLFNYDANDRLTTDSYDNNGNTIVNASISNTYDFENHLIQRGAITIVYDGDGNRVSKTAGGVTTKYLVDANNLTGYSQVLEEIQSGSVVRTYVYGLDLISQKLGASGLSFYGYDGHGSVRNLTDSTGAITDTYDYDAFGNLINRTGTTNNNYLYAGEQFDPDLNLYYNRARYLDVRVGRFWGMDEHEPRNIDPQSLHRYLYAHNNPINLNDPSGRNAVQVVVAVSLIAVVAVIGYSIAVERIRNSIGPFPLSSKEYFKLLRTLNKLVVDLRVPNEECDQFVCAKLGIDKSAIANFLQGHPAFYDGPKTELTLSAAGLKSSLLSGDTVADFFKKSGSDAVTKTPSNPFTAYFDSKYVAAAETSDLEAALFHEALHAFGGFSDDDLKVSFFGNRANTGAIAGTRVITSYIKEYCKF